MWWSAWSRHQTLIPAAPSRRMCSQALQRASTRETPEFLRGHRPGDAGAGGLQPGPEPGDPGCQVPGDIFRFALPGPGAQRCGKGQGHPGPDGGRAFRVRADNLAEDLLRRCQDAMYQIPLGRRPG